LFSDERSGRRNTHVIASEAKQSIPKTLSIREMDCFASLAMTARGSELHPVHVSLCSYTAIGAASGGQGS